jgi:phage gpG-like protein
VSGIAIRFADTEIAPAMDTLGMLAGDGLLQMLVRMGVPHGVGRLAVRSVQRGIREQVSPDGTPYARTTRYGRPAQRLRDSGRLINSMTYAVDGARTIVGTNLIYAPTQHYGDEARRPKTAKKLGIPLTRQVARAVAAAGGYRAAFPKAFTFVSKKGNLLLAQRRTRDEGGTLSKRIGLGRRGEALELLALLVDEESIAGTHFNDLSDRGQREVVDYIAVMAARAIGGRNAGA